MAGYLNQQNRQSIRIPEYDYSQPGAYFVTLVTRERECLFGEIINGRMVLSPLGRIAEEQWLRLPVRFPNWAIDAFQIMPNHMHGVLNKKGILAVGAVGAQRSINYAGSDSATLRPASNIKGESLPDTTSMGKPGASEGSLPDTTPLNKPGASDGSQTGAASPNRPCASDGSLRPYRPGRPDHPGRPDRPNGSNRHNVATDSLGAVVRAYKSAVSFRYQQTSASPGHPLWQRNYYEHIVRDEDDLDRIRLYIRENPLRWSEDEDNILPTYRA
ncbi:MAG: transposase [Anaerolineaceae bacterium]